MIILKLGSNETAVVVVVIIAIIVYGRELRKKRSKETTCMRVSIAKVLLKKNQTPSRLCHIDCFFKLFSLRRLDSLKPQHDHC